MLRLNVDWDGKEHMADTLRRVALLAPHCDEVTVDTTGPGLVLADRLERMQIEVRRYSPVGELFKVDGHLTDEEKALGIDGK